MQKRSREQPEHVKRSKRADVGDTWQHSEQVEEIPETQHPPNRVRSLEEGSTNGVIESVFLKDFMCHSRLEFNFGGNVNFIIGRNGSGKSAILTAVVVALGGKANVTSRGTSLKNFIKSGKRDAKVVVRLKNKGSDSYKPEEYGQQIVVERRITTDGSSHYKIMSKDGKVISTKREELLRILDAFNIQIDNPMCVLNQEVSRNFLNSKNSKDKYTFFLKATQLEHLRNEYTLTEEQKCIAEQLLKRKKENLLYMERELKEWEQKREFLDSLAKQQEKLQNLKQELIWVHIKDREEKLMDRKQELEKAEHNKAACVKKVEEWQCKVSSLTAERNKIQSELAVITERIKDFHPQHRTAKNALTELKQQFRAKHLDMRKITNTVNSIQRDVEELQKKIQELRSGGQGDHARERQKRMETLEKLQEKKEELAASERSTSTHYDQLKSSVTHLRDEINSLLEEQKDKQHQMDTIESQIRNLEGSRSDHLRKFGSYIPKLKNSIEVAYHQKKFVEKPRGPIGACIKVKDQRWALAVEVCIRPLMTTFCCDNHQDERVLEQLMRDVIQQGRKPSIIVSKFSNHIYDVREYAVKTANYPNVLDMLEISDPVVANCLIDQRGIESVLLIADNKVARQKMLHNVPRNCKETFTMSGDQVYAAPNFRYYSNSKKHPELLHRDLSEQIQQKKSELQDVEKHLRTLSDKIAHSRSLLSMQMKETRSVEANLERISKDITELNLKIMELQNTEEPEPIDISILEEELESLLKKKEELSAQHQLEKQQLDQLNQSIALKQSEYAESESTISSLLGSTEPLKDRINEVEMKLQDAQERKKHYDARLRELGLKTKQLKRAHDEEIKVLQENTRQAESICPRIESARTIANLESQIIMLEEHLKKEESSQGTHEDVIAKYVELKTKYDSVVILVKTVEDFLEALSKALEQRKRAYESFRKQLTMRTKIVFINALSQRNFQGKLVIDHQKETLDIVMHGDGKGNSKVHDMHSLSGGERSFTTVSLIIAMWDCTESPFRILDEFDVFMDMVTRRVSVDIMLNTALRKQKCQFIFLTPLGMTSIPRSNYVRICQMPDPDRHQSVLPFSSRNNEEESEGGS